MRAKRRRLNKRQKDLASKAIKFIAPAVASFLKKNPDLRKLALTLDLESVAAFAVCVASTTFDPDKSLPQTYFGSAIRHALFKEVLAAQRTSRRFVATEEIRTPTPNASRVRQHHRAMKAMRLLTAYERTLLEDRLIEQVTLEQLAYEQGCDPRTVSKRIKLAIQKLQAIEKDMP